MIFVIIIKIYGDLLVQKVFVFFFVKNVFLVVKSSIVNEGVSWKLQKAKFKIFRFKKFKV